MFQADVIKVINLIIRPINRYHTGPTVSCIFGTHPGSPYLSECQALSAIRSGSPQWYQTGFLSASITFLEIGRNYRVPNHSIRVGGV
jgi:hypothetical protein